MSAIEKICEFSGRYEGPDMYKYKRDQLQILPEYRKRFRGAHVLVTVSVSVVYLVRQFRTKHGNFLSESYFSSAWKEDTRNFPEKPLTFMGFVNYNKSVEGKRTINEYRYTVHAFADHLKGEVNGNYVGWTSNLSTLRRKLRRLTRNYKLKLVMDKTTYPKEYNSKRLPRFY